MNGYLLKRSACLSVLGPDALTYLQGQCSQDLTKLADGQSTYGLWLSPKGRLLADSLIYREAENRYVLFSLSQGKNDFHALIEKNVIMDDVTVEVLDDYRAVAFFEKEILPDGEIVMHHPLGMTVVIFTGGKAFSLESELSEEAFTYARLERGIVMIPQEFGEKDLPVEAGLDEVGVSYEKGCFLGQDMLARLRLQGDSRKIGVVLAGKSESLPSLPCDLWAGEKKIGELRAAAIVGADSVGVAKIIRAEVGKQLSIRSDSETSVALHPVS